MNKKTKKRTLSMALAAALAFSPVQAFAASSDIAGHWAEDVITQWENAGMISGYEDGTFRPNNSVTRAEFVIMMNNALGLTETGEVSFSDVQPGNWFYNAVAIAVAAGYCSGYEDGTFKPSATITRAEAAVMIANAAGLEQDATGAAGFTDSIPAWAQGSVGAVVNAGFMSGYPDGTFAANQSITRAEAVSSLNRVIGGVTANDVVVTEATEIADQTIDGNLIIDAALTDGTVTVKNTTVKGNIVVRGGSAEALKLDGVTVEGKLIVEKEGAEVVLTGETKVPSVEISALSTLSEDNFKGSVGTITITKNLDTDKTVKLSVAADKLVLDGTAAVDVNKDIKTVEITKDAEGSKVYVNKGATVDTVVADAKANVSGSGTVKVLEANADGITLGSSLTVNKTEVAEGVEKPTTSTSGGGGGGGGSSSSSDDDDVVVTPTFVVDGTTDKTWAKAAEAAKATTSANYKILVKGSATGITTTEPIVFAGKGTLTIQFEDGQSIAASQTLDINAENVAKIELMDSAAGTNGVVLDTLKVNAPKGTVNDNFVATTRDIKEVSNATFNVKDNDGTTTVNIGQGTVNVAGVPGTVDVNVNGAGPVTVKGTAASVDVIAGGENAVVNIAGTVTGDVNTTGTAATINVVDGAKIDTLTAQTGVIYNLQGGTIETLAVGAETVTVEGATVNEATVAAGTLTVNSGSVAKATVDTGKVEGTGKVGTVDVTGANATVGVATVDTIKLGASATPVTVNSKTVGTIEAGATSGQITLANDAKVNALIATEETTLADNTAGNTGKIGTVVAVSNKVTVQDAKQVGSVKLSNGGTVEVQGSGPISGVEKTEISKVTLKTAPATTQYNKGQELNLSDMELTVEQTVTGADGKVVSSDPVNLTYDQAKDLLTGDELFDSATVGAGKTLTFKYAGLDVNDAEGQKYTYTYDVVLSQEDWADAAKTALDGQMSGFSDGVKAVKVGAKETLKGTFDASGDIGVVNVAWASSDASYVDIQKSGNDWTADVKKADRDESHKVTATATITSADEKYSTTVSYTFEVEAVNAGAVKAWGDIEASITKLNPIKVKDVPQDAGAAQTAIETALKDVISTADGAGYTLTVKEVVQSGSDWNATLHLIDKTGANKEDYVEKQVTFTIQDEAAGAKEALAKVEAKVPTSLAVASGKSQSESDVKAAIEANLQAVLGTDKTYKVSVTGTLSEQNAEKKTSTWKGTITVTGSGQDVATSTKEYTINITEGTDITLSGDPIEGTNKKVGPATVTLKAGNTTFKDVKENDVVTSWFTNLPSGLVATVKSATEDTVTIEITLPAEQTCAVTETKALDVEVPAANLESGTALKATGTVNITIKEAQEGITVENLTATPDHTTLKITLLNGKKFNTGTAGTYSNYAWNNKTLESGTSIQAEETTVTITLEDLDKVTATQKNVSVTIQPEAFAADSIVTPEDVKVEYYTPLTKDDNLIKGNIQDTVSDPKVTDLYTSHDIQVDAELDPAQLNVVKVLTKDLKQHKNGPGTLGHWTGFAVTVPDGTKTITAAKYATAETADALPDTLSKSVSVSKVDELGTKDGIAFYTDITKDGVKFDHRYVAVQFCDAQGNAITPVYKFDVDFTESTLANQDVVLEANGTDYIIEGENAATSGGTIAGGSINTITTSTTGTELLAGLQVKGASENKNIKVMTAEEAETVTGEFFAEAFDKVTGKTDATLEGTDVVVVMSADRSVVGKYTVTVTEGP